MTVGTALDFDVGVRARLRRSRAREPGTPARVVEIVYEPTPERDARLLRALDILLTSGGGEGDAPVAAS